MKVIDGPNQDSIYVLNEHEIYSVGRKETNQMSFPDDQHLSGIHSKIFRIKDLWYIEDIATTNGYSFYELEHGSGCPERERKAPAFYSKINANSS